MENERSVGMETQEKEEKTRDGTKKKILRKKDRVVVVMSLFRNLQ